MKLMLPWLMSYVVRPSPPARQQGLKSKRFTSQVNTSKNYLVIDIPKDRFVNLSSSLVTTITKLAVKAD
jgi:hypothetical protein